MKIIIDDFLMSIILVVTGMFGFVLLFFSQDFILGVILITIFTMVNFLVLIGVLEALILEPMDLEEKLVALRRKRDRYVEMKAKVTVLRNQTKNRTEDSFFQLAIALSQLVEMEKENYHKAQGEIRKILLKKKAISKSNPIFMEASND